MSARAWVVAFMFAGCEAYDALLPDGGRGQVNCTPGDALNVTVRVVGPLGAAAPGASVVATWLSYDNVSATFGTNGQGVAVLRPQFGPGVVRVTARLNDLQAPPQDVTYAGGDCINAVSPRDVELKLQ